MNGDAFRIRGFDAKGDIYVDGLRDFGAYVRDDFATESIQVFKGSSSESFGNGTTGGAINQEQKKARLGDASSLQATLGNGPQKRAVKDGVARDISEMCLNQKLAGVEGIYDQYTYFAERRQALLLWIQFLTSCATKELSADCVVSASVA